MRIDWLFGFHAETSHIYIHGELYMRRWLIGFRQFGLRLHNIVRPDPDICLHDHPFSFVSFVLYGGYVEISKRKEVLEEYPNLILICSTARNMWTWAFRRAEHLHTISHVEPNTWTLVLRGPIRREWGFQTAEGWVDWRTYTGFHNSKDIADGRARSST